MQMHNQTTDGWHQKVKHMFPPLWLSQTTWVKEPVPVSFAASLILRSPFTIQAVWAVSLSRMNYQRCLAKDSRVHWMWLSEQCCASLCDVLFVCTVRKSSQIPILQCCKSKSVKELRTSIFGGASSSHSQGHMWSACWFVRAECT